MKTDSRLVHIQNDSKAIGIYYYHSGSVAILEGNIKSVFYTKAIIEKDATEGYQGCFNNYFIVSNKLWKLLD